MITVRTAQRSDISLLVKFYKALYGTSESEETNIFTKNDNTISTYLVNIPGEFVLALKDGTLVGALNLKKENKTLRIINLFSIAAGYRQEGAATTLLNFVEHKLHGQGKVEVKTSAAGIKNFFQTKGYAVEGTLSNHFGLGRTAYILGKLI